MRYNVSSLLKAPVGARLTLTLDVIHQQLGNDLVVESICGSLLVTRTDKRLLAQGPLKIVMQAECVRCLEVIPHLTFEMDFEESFVLHPINAGKRKATFGVTEDGCLDLTYPLREQIIVWMPIRPLCRPDCKGLCSQCGHNLNLGPCGCSEESIDPRLAALKSLLK